MTKVVKDVHVGLDRSCRLQGLEAFVQEGHVRTQQLWWRRQLRRGSLHGPERDLMCYVMYYPQGLRGHRGRVSEQKLARGRGTLCAAGAAGSPTWHALQQ